MFQIEGAPAVPAQRRGQIARARRPQYRVDEGAAARAAAVGQKIGGERRLPGRFPPRRQPNQSRPHISHPRRALFGTFQFGGDGASGRGDVVPGFGQGNLHHANPEPFQPFGDWQRHPTVGQHHLDPQRHQLLTPAARARIAAGLGGKQRLAGIGRIVGDGDDLARIGQPQQILIGARRQRGRARQGQRRQRRQPEDQRQRSPPPPAIDHRKPLKTGNARRDRFRVRFRCSPTPPRSVRRADFRRARTAASGRPAGSWPPG